MKSFCNLWFALACSIGLLVCGSVIAAATTGTPHQLLGAVPVGLAVGVGGCWTGTVVRRRRRSR